MMPARLPVVLDLDRSVSRLPGEKRIDLSAWQESVRFGCGQARMRLFADALDAGMPPFDTHGTVFIGSGDFHHASAALIARCIAAQPDARPNVVVLDNHPDNMRFPFGIHCGSWVRQVALLPQVAHVYVAGITSSDIGVGHAWENRLAPLAAGKLSYWSISVRTGWARALGLGHAFRSFASGDALVAALCDTLRSDARPAYLSIDKDVFSREVVQTNWDQGVLQAAHAEAVIDALRGRIAGSDVTGDVSWHRYRTPWKRWLSALDGQSTGQAPQAHAHWRAGQHRLDLRLLARLQASDA